MSKLIPTMSAEDAQWLSFARWLRFHLTSKEEAVTGFVDELMSDFKQSYGKTIRQPEYYNQAFTTILLDLFRAFKSVKINSQFLMLHRDHTKYPHPDNPHLGWFLLTNVLDYLELSGHITQKAGIHFENKGYVTKIAPTVSLIKEFDQRDWSPSMVSFLSHRPIIITQKIIPKAKKNGGGRKPKPVKKIIEVYNEKNARQFIEGITKINEAMMEIEVTHNMSVNQQLDLVKRFRGRISFPAGDPVQYHRTFRRIKEGRKVIDFESGGRFYGGPWQNWPRDCRKHLLIDKMPVAELDYGSLYARILYAKAGAEVKVCPYMPPGYEAYRSFNKVAFNMMLNVTTGPAGVIGALKAKAEETKDREHPFISPFPSWHNKIMLPYFDGIAKHNEPISEYFYTNPSGMLERIESDICEAVLLELIDLKLPIALLEHDSYIVDKRFTKKLATAMQSKFQEVADSPYPIQIDRKY